MNKEQTESRRGCEFSGNIVTIRAIEDCIRATKKYTEGIDTLRYRHPIQGEDTPSRWFRKYYEVYPELELDYVDWNMGAGTAINLLWGDTPCIDVVFIYDYRVNKASVTVKDKLDALEKLLAGIPGLCDLLSAEMTTNGYRETVAPMIKNARETEKARRESPVGKPKPRAHGIWNRIVERLTPTMRNQ